MKKKVQQDTKPLGVIVVELDDVVERRDPDLPNLYVASTASSIEDRFDYLKRNNLKTSMRPEWIRGHIVRLRRDLSVPTQQIDASLKRALLHDTVTGLKSRGFTVNRDTYIWRVYVIELDSSAVKDPGLGVLYVGQTVRTPEERFKQHTTKAKSSKSRPIYSSVVARHGTRLRMDLAPRKPFFDRESAKRAEAEWADHLRSLGYVVKGGH